jgi:phosphoglycolate phosphatase-like HAD superfamily hydrolase
MLSGVRASAASLMTSSKKPVLRGVVFDMDGTITKPNLDFKLMYERCGVSRENDLLAEIAKMPAEKAAVALEVIDEMEAEGRRTLQLEPGAIELCRWLRAHSLPVALVTRNSAESVEHLHAALCGPAGMPRFDPAVSRDDAGIPPKPDPTAMQHISHRWSLAPDTLLMVGDSPLNDVAFGKAAGAHTALVDSGRRVIEGAVSSGGADLVVASLAELPRAIWAHFTLPGPTGEPILTKYGAPTPASAASAAAAAGHSSLLQGFSAAELAQPDPSSENSSESWSGKGNTPLIWAADAGRQGVVEGILGTLLAAGPAAAAATAVNARGYLGATAVSRAARRGHSDVLRLLCAVPGIDLDTPNIKMQTPLHFAAFKRHEDAVRVLLEAGANPRALDRKGRTPDQDTDVAAIRDLIANWGSGLPA